MKKHRTYQKRFFALLLAVLMTVAGLTAAGPGAVTAADSFPADALITVNGKTVERTDGISQVTALFGQPKLVTDSPFGGSAYAFYGSGYQDYLYLETNSNGSIAAYGSVGDDFQTAVVDSGETYRDNYVRSYRVAVDGDDVVYGFVGYTRSASLGPTAYHQAIAADMNRYDTALCRHSVEMFNAVSALYGYDTPVSFDQETYERSLQLAENGSNVYQYSSAVGKTGYVNLFATGGYNFAEYSYINPLYFAQSALNRSIPSDIDKAQFIFYASENRYRYFNGTANPDLYQDQVVPLTEEEEQTIAEMKEMYQRSVDEWNLASSYYQTEPSYTSLPITAGVVDANVLQSSVEYLNLIRYGAGIGPLVLDQTLCDGAQAKATYTMYLSANGISNPTPHYPPKVDGISDEFYSLCQTGRGENLYNGDVLTSITHALDDTSGDPINCGHRYNLLDPTYTAVGLGSTGSGLFPQGVQKFSGYQENTVDAVCWPSDGITPVEAIYVDQFQWTAKLYRYSVTTDTDVSVTCLNTGDEWQFSTQAGNLHRSVSENFLSWDDDNLSVSAGNVYQVTISNVVDETTGQTTDYTYRAVIARLYVSEAGEVTDITLDRTQYTGNPGDVVKLNATITPYGVDNARVDWSSSDETVATVSQNGVVTLHSNGTAIITASAGNGSFTARAEITVAPFHFLYDLNQDQQEDVLDVMTLAQMIVNQQPYQKQMDYNENQELDVGDVMYLAQRIVNQL